MNCYHSFCDVKEKKTKTNEIDWLQKRCIQSVGSVLNSIPLESFQQKPND